MLLELPILGLMFLALVLVIARWGTNPRRHGREQEAGMAIAPARLRELVTELLETMGMRVTLFEGDEQQLRVTRPGPLRDTHQVVVLEADPPGEVVSASAILELAEQTRYEAASAGLLIT